MGKDIKESEAGASSGEPAAMLEERIVNLTKTLETFSSEIESLKTSLQKRKSENTTLKILVYTGLIVLVLGSYYTNSALQRAQTESVETHMNQLQSRMNQEMVAMEKNLHGRLDNMGRRIDDISVDDAHGALDRMNSAISRLNPKDAKTAALINDVLKHSRALQSAYEGQAAASAKNSQSADVIAQNEVD